MKTINTISFSENAMKYLLQFDEWSEQKKRDFLKKYNPELYKKLYDTSE